MAQVKNKKTIAVVVAACALLAAVFSAVYFWPQEVIVPGSAEGDMTIETEYCDLYYPARWKELVKIRIQDGCVTFYADLKRLGEYPLFDISFTDNGGALYGTIRTKDGMSADVYLSAYPVSGKRKLRQENMDLLYAMQDDMNQLCGKLPLVNDPESDPEKVVQAEDIEIITPYGTLTYPGIWDSYLRRNAMDGYIYSIEFYANVEGHPEQHLFDIHMGPYLNGEYQLCVLEDGSVVTLDLVRYPLELDNSWSQSQADILYGMMEDAQLLIRDLMPAKTAEQNWQEDILVDTPYGQLWYSGQWRDMIRTETVSADPYTVAFYGSAPDHKDVHLYDVCFGMAQENAIGIVSAAGKTAVVSIRYYSVPVDRGWTQEQMNAVYALQETAADVLTLIPLEDVYTFLEEDDAQNDVEDILIKTPYGEVRYPGKWKDNVRIEEDWEKSRSAHFYGSVGGYPEQHLFTLAFGGREGIEVAVIADEQGKAVNVYMIPGEITGPEGPHKDLLYSMQEDFNYLIRSLTTAVEG